MKAMKVSLRAGLTGVLLPLVALLALFLPTAGAQAVKDLPQPTDYVNDFARVLSPEAVARIDAICAQLDHTQANAQVAVVTVRSLEGDDAANYANDLEDKWKIGKKGSDRGVLILLAVNDHKYRIEVGYGLEGILPDGKVGDIGRNMVPDLRQNDYDGALTFAVGEIAQVIADDAHVTLDQELQSQGELRTVHRGSGAQKLILLILLLVFFGGFSLLRILFAGGLFFGGWGGGGPWIGGGGWGGGGYGGGGGGSGGGFGGFGGGSFGGGGAGGSW
jgi:uncharacterized protein